MVSSSKHEDEREEKWLSLLNHIIDVHVHKDFKLIKKCIHEVLDRELLKPGKRAILYLQINVQPAHKHISPIPKTQKIN